MDQASGSFTSTTLLERLRNPADAEARNEFVRRYEQPIREWARKSLQSADADDASQDVLQKILVRRRIESFDPEKGRFRSWLRTVVGNAVKDVAKQRKRAGVGSGDDDVWEQLLSLESGRELEDRLASAFDLELKELAMARTQASLEAPTWRAFQLHKVEGRPAAEVAAALNKSPGAVMTACHRTLLRIRKEIDALEG
jgi:RNA polymerase sigma-70 factor (ECF subfamily)